MKPDGETVTAKTSMMYLGAMLSADGRFGSELGRRIGNAQADSRVLRKVSGHSTLNLKRKLHIYYACIVSKLLYGLHTTWLNVTERRRLDGFHTRCLRRILGISAAYYSRVSNTETVCLFLEPSTCAARCRSAVAAVPGRLGPMQYTAKLWKLPAVRSSWKNYGSTDMSTSGA